jgi:hypothetical protein
MHELYRVGAKTNLSPAAQGVILASLSRAVDTGMSRDTYTSNGKTDFVGGLFKVGSNVLDGQAMLADATIFTVAPGRFKLAGKMTNGALERSNFAPLHFGKDTNKPDAVTPKNSFALVDASTRVLNASTTGMDAPANEAQVRNLFEQITHPQGSYAMAEAHAEALRLFANNPQLETVARQIPSELRKSDAENKDVVARLIRVGFKNEPLDTSELTESRSRALDKFKALAKDLHVVDKHAEAQEGIFRIIARAELPTRIEQQLHEQSRDPLLVQTLDSVLGTDYIHSVQVNKNNQRRHLRRWHKNEVTIKSEMRRELKKRLSWAEMYIVRVKT